MNFIYPVLDFFLVGALFWPLTIILGVWAYIILHGKDDFRIGPFFILSLIGATIVYRIESAREFLSSWQNIATAIAYYIGAGFVVALAKWIILITKLRRAVQSGNSISKFHTKETTDGNIMLDWSDYSVSSWWVYWPIHFLYCVFEPLRLLMIWLTTLFKGMFIKLAEMGSISRSSINK